MCADDQFLFVGTNVMVIVIDKPTLKAVAKTGKGNHKEVRLNLVVVNGHCTS
jgi:hypothetical protein